MKRTLVVVVDAQYDFVMADGLLSVPGAESIVVPGIRYLSHLDPDEVAGVLFTYDTHTRDQFFGSLENLGDPARGIPGFPLHCEAGTTGWANVFNMALVPDDIPVWMLRKNVFDMWEQPSHEVQIQAVARHGEFEHGAMHDREFFFLGAAGNVGSGDQPRGPRLEGVDKVRVFGVASDYCVKWAVQGFLDRGFEVEVVEHLTAGIQRDMAKTVEDDFPGRVGLV